MHDSDGNSYKIMMGKVWLFSCHVILQASRKIRWHLKHKVSPIEKNLKEFLLELHMTSPDLQTQIHSQNSKSKFLRSGNFVLAHTLSNWPQDTP